jgi:hypothetical protein
MALLVMSTWFTKYAVHKMLLPILVRLMSLFLIYAEIMQAGIQQQYRDA